MTYLNCFTVRYFFQLISLLFVLASCNSDQQAKNKPSQASVTVFTHRYYAVDQQLFDRFETNTGIKVKVVKDTEEALLDRMRNDINNPGGDIFLASDVYWLEMAKKDSLLQPFFTANLDRNLPTRYRDRDRQWVALSRGAMGIAFAKNKIDFRPFYQYENLGYQTYKNQLILGNPKSTGNRGLVAGMIAMKGEAYTRQWLKAVVNNRVQDYVGSTDYDVIKAIAAGKGMMAFVPHSAMLQMKASGNKDFADPATQVAFLFPSFEDKKSIFYLSAAGILRNAPNAENAVRLLEFLTDAVQQPEYTGVTIDYTVNPMALSNDFLDEIGGFYEITLRIDEVIAYFEKADQLMTEAGWQ
jgi:iron(III) transport system substrate-binding protein